MALEHSATKRTQKKTLTFVLSLGQQLLLLLFGAEWYFSSSLRHFASYLFLFPSPDWFVSFRFFFVLWWFESTSLCTAHLPYTRNSTNVQFYLRRNITKYFDAVVGEMVLLIPLFWHFLGGLLFVQRSTVNEACARHSKLVSVWNCESSRCRNVIAVERNQTADQPLLRWCSCAVTVYRKLFNVLGATKWMKRWAFNRVLAAVLMSRQIDKINCKHWS